MTNFYVSTKRGSDSTGTGTAANPWKTIGRAIGANPAIALSGPTRLYIEPGAYYESVALSLTPSAAAPLEIVGDCDGAGFLAGGHETPSTGVVEWSAWSSDATANTAACLQGSTRSFVTVRSLKFFGGSSSANGFAGSCLWVTSGANWTVADCVMISHSNAAGPPRSFSAAGAGLNSVVERCDFQLSATFGATGVRVAAAEAASEYDLGTAVRNCRFFGAGGASSVGLWVGRPASTGLGALGTGLSVRSCTFHGVGTGVAAYGGVSIALATPISVEGCLFLWTSTGVSAGLSGQLVENRNAFHCPTPRTNTAAGTESTATIRPAVDFGDGLLTGVPLRPFGEPTPGSPLGGFVASGFPAVDRTGRARPEGFGSHQAAVGALERHDTGESDAAFADAGSPACLALRGPASLERPILVDPAATTIRVKVRWDGLHGDAAKPRAILLANPEIGLATDQVLTASSSGGSGSTPNAYETLSFAPFTPSRSGVVMLRMVSRSASGTGTAYFDSITLS